MRRVFVTGSPGVGKSTVARELGAKYGVPVVDIARVAVERGCVVRYVDELETYEVDVPSLERELEELLLGMRSFVVEGHLVEAVPSYLVDLVVVLRLHPRLLEERLVAKGQPPEKVRENVLSEILDVCLASSVERFGESRVHEVDTTGRSVEEVVEEISRVVEGVIKPRHGSVDWISVLEREGLLDRYLL